MKENSVAGWVNLLHINTREKKFYFIDEFSSERKVAQAKSFIVKKIIFYLLHILNACVCVSVSVSV